MTGQTSITERLPAFDELMAKRDGGIHLDPARTVALQDELARWDMDDYACRFEAADHYGKQRFLFIASHVLDMATFAEVAETVFGSAAALRKVERAEREAAAHKSAWETELRLHEDTKQRAERAERTALEEGNRADRAERNAAANDNEVSRLAALVEMLSDEIAAAEANSARLEKALLVQAKLTAEEVTLRETLAASLAAVMENHKVALANAAK